MSWNYRIIYHPPKKDKLGKKVWTHGAFFAIHEVYYDKKGKLEGYAEDPSVIGDEISDINDPVNVASSLKSLQTILQHLSESLNKGILKLSDF